MATPGRDSIIGYVVSKKRQPSNSMDLKGIDGRAVVRASRGPERALMENSFFSCPRLRPVKSRNLVAMRPVKRSTTASRKVYASRIDTFKTISRNGEKSMTLFGQSFANGA